MALDEKRFSYSPDHALRDTRPLGVRIADWFRDSDNAAITIFIFAGYTLFFNEGILFIDIALVLMGLFMWWLSKQDRTLAHKLPAFSPLKTDPKNTGGGRSGKPEGIMYLGNTRGNASPKPEEIWFTNNDIRTHMMYLGTTGSGKTEGLKSIVTNALCWGSGFVYIDGKADTDLWSSLSSLCRRFGRDDDLLVVNYMTGNSDKRAPSNSLNPFSGGSASYLTNMLVSLMPEAGGDNAMWKERAVSLLGSIMPALTWLRDNMDVPLSISSVRHAMNFPDVIKLSRNEALPAKLRESVKGYLDTLPGYVDAAFDDDGKEKPMGPDVPQSDAQVPMQQHGYLTMQFTRSLQSLGDEYGYIFDVDNADIDMIDVVLNRRILVVLIPALEKSGDETANLGKIVSATLKGMMGSTLGATVEGDTSTVIENKPTNSSTPFITVFDEVGYYVTDGMAVMAAQARSLGFCLVYAAQDLAALEKRVKEEARSITANCNIKIFGKLSDPTVTKDLYEKTIGKAIVTQVSGFNVNTGSLSGAFESQQQASISFYDRISYDSLQEYKEGNAALLYSNAANEIQVFYCNPGHAKAMRVQKLLGFGTPNDYVMKNIKNIAGLRDRLMHKTWTAEKADVSTKSDPRLDTIIAGMTSATENGLNAVEQGAMALAHLYATENTEAMDKLSQKNTDTNTTSTDTNAPVTETDGNKSTDMSWTDIMNSDTSSVDKDDIMDEILASQVEEDRAEDSDESSTSGSSSGAVSPNTYSAEDAITEKADSGLTVLPENLSDEVKAILQEAADTVTAGLFTPPTMDRYNQGGGDSKGFKASKVSPAQKPGQGRGV